MNNKSISLTLFFLLLYPSIILANIRLPHIISENMVLQRESLCKLWGWANENEKVKVKASWGIEMNTIADSTGNWQVSIQTPEAGGPYYIDFIGENYLRVSNVLIGDVWLATGQGNMEIALYGWRPYDTVTNSDKLIAESRNENIRLLSIQQQASFNPEKDANCWWKKASPNTTIDFSALAYLFAKKINAETGIPIGIIESRWNGSNTESWLDINYCKEISTLKGQIAEFEQAAPHQKELLNWIRSHPKLLIGSDYSKRFKNVDFLDKEVCRLSFNDGDWKTITLPNYFDIKESIGPFDGIVWFRKWVTIPGDWVQKKLKLSLGPIDDMDATFVNGEQVGETMEDGKWSEQRIYEINPGLIRSDLLIAIRVIDNGNGGGIYGPKENFCIYPEGEKDKAISLAGDWKYLPTAEFMDNNYYYYNYKHLEYYNRPKTITLDMKTISGSYNAMIYPISNFKISGVICAMGESNVGKAGEYLQLFPALVNNWRSAFNNEKLPFYYTQITPYRYQAGESYKLREAQRRCQKLIPYSGMTSTMDEARNISFQNCNKEKIANRLAAWALRDVYKKDIEVCGPELESFVINKDKAELTFSHTTGGIVSKDGKDLKYFEVVDSKGIAYTAHTQINGNKITVWADECKSIKAVRYAYKDWVEDVNFYNGAGFPASSFTTEKKVEDTK